MLFLYSVLFVRYPPLTAQQCSASQAVSSYRSKECGQRTPLNGRSKSGYRTRTPASSAVPVTFLMSLSASVIFTSSYMRHFNSGSMRAESKCAWPMSNTVPDPACPGESGLNALIAGLVKKQAKWVNVLAVRIPTQRGQGRRPCYPARDDAATPSSNILSCPVVRPD